MEENGTKEVSTRALTIIEQANVLTVKDEEDYVEAGVLWKAIKELKDKVNETFKPIIEKAHAAHKEALAQKAKIFDPLEMAGRLVKGIMESWDRAQEAIRQAEERRLREIARKEEEERRLQEAIEAEANGETEEAEAIIQEEIYVPPIILQKETPKVVGGPVYRTIWDFEIVDEKLIPFEYLQPNMIKIGSVVRSLKSATNIPGIRAFSRRV